MNEGKKKLRGLIGCEESQAVATAFNNSGHDFHSCDVLPCSGGHPEYHYEDDIFHRLHKVSIDFFGSHPPCTYLANSGVRWLYNSDGSRNEQRWEKMRLAAIFFRSLLSWTKTIGRGYVENPIIHKHALEIIGERPTQIIQPWQFGHGEQKATCLWVVGLPKLQPTNIVEGREQRIWKMAPTKDPKKRQTERSKTFPGIAQAMADQWG